MDLIRNLQRNNFEVYVTCPSKCNILKSSKSEIRKFFKENNIKFIPLEINRSSFNFLSDIFNFFKLYRFIKKEKINYSLSYTLKCVFYSGFMSKIFNINNTFSNISGVGYIFMNNKFLVSLIRFVMLPLYRSSLSNYKKVIFQNLDDLNFYLNLKLVKKTQSTVISGSGIDINYFNIKKNIVRDKDFIFVGRFLYDKGIDTYLKACMILKDKYPYVTFSIAGNFDQNPSSISKDLLNYYVKNNTVHNYGQVKNIKPILNSHKIIVLPSKREGLSKTLLEGMAMSMPLITSDVPGCKELVLANKNGFIVPFGNVKKLVTSMEYFIKNPNSIVKFGKLSREIVSKKYSSKLINSEITKLLLNKQTSLFPES